MDRYSQSLAYGRTARRWRSGPSALGLIAVAAAFVLFAALSSLGEVDFGATVEAAAQALRLARAPEILLPALSEAQRSDIIERLSGRIDHLKGRSRPPDLVNYDALTRVRDCLKQDHLFDGPSSASSKAEYIYCAKALKVTILHSSYCRSHLDGLMRGEDVACGSYQHSVRRLGHTFIVETGIGQHLADLYNCLTEDLVVNIYVEKSQMEDLVKGGFAIDRHAFTDKNSTIPVDRILVSDWWGLRDGVRDVHPLGTRWWITPYYIPGHTFIGYSVEELCKHRETIPIAQRKNGVALLAKNRQYLFPESSVAFIGQDFITIEKELDINIDSYIGDYQIDRYPDLPAGLTNHGQLASANYTEALRNSIALLGLGSPGSSPTPYLALCLGVPFINPHFKTAPLVEDWYLSNNMFERQTYQHGPLAHYGPPYVYNVEYRDVDALAAALRSAMANPIPSWLPEEVTNDAQDERVRRLFARDLVREAEEVYFTSQAVRPVGGIVDAM